MPLIKLWQLPAQCDTDIHSSPPEHSTIGNGVIRQLSLEGYWQSPLFNSISPLFIPPAQFHLLFTIHQDFIYLFLRPVLAKGMQRLQAKICQLKDMNRAQTVVVCPSRLPLQTRNTLFPQSWSYKAPNRWSGIQQQEPLLQQYMTQTPYRRAKGQHLTKSSYPVRWRLHV